MHFRFLRSFLTVLLPRFSSVVVLKLMFVDEWAYQAVLECFVLGAVQPNSAAQFGTIRGKQPPCAFSSFCWPCFCDAYVMQCHAMQCNVR